MARCQLVLEIRVRFWVIPCIKFLYLLYKITNKIPDEERIEKIINSGMSYEVKKK